MLPTTSNVHRNIGMHAWRVGRREEEEKGIRHIQYIYMALWYRAHKEMTHGMHVIALPLFSFLLLKVGGDCVWGQACVDERLCMPVPPPLPYFSYYAYMR